MSEKNQGRFLILKKKIHRRNGKEGEKRKENTYQPEGWSRRPPERVKEHHQRDDVSLLE